MPYSAASAIAALRARSFSAALIAGGPASACAISADADADADGADAIGSIEADALGNDDGAVVTVDDGAASSCRLHATVTTRATTTALRSNH